MSSTWWKGIRRFWRATGAFEPLTIHYAETFIVPASVGEYIIRPAQEPCVNCHHQSICARWMMKFPTGLDLCILDHELAFRYGPGVFGPP